jgi:hypothetical protein
MIETLPWRAKGKLSPHVWKSGPDPVDHTLYVQCQRARAQANFRNEDWQITEQEFINIWRIDDRYKLRGRGLNSLCMIRVDTDLPWTIDNVEIISRVEHLKTCNKEKLETTNWGKGRRKSL